MLCSNDGSVIRPLLRNLTFTIAGLPEHLPHCASAYEGDLIKNLVLIYDWVGQIQYNSCLCEMFACLLVIFRGMQLNVILAKGGTI